MKHIIYKILVFSLMCLFLSQCSCDEEPKPDPCAGVKESSAEFITNDYLNINRYVYENVHWRDLEINKKDLSVFEAGTQVHFIAKDTSATSYLWKVGTDTTKYTDRAFSLYIPLKMHGISIKVSLTIKKKKNSYTCFKDDDSIKTSTKIIKFVKDAPYYGNWNGYYTSNPKDTFTIRVYKGYWNELNDVGDSIPTGPSIAYFPKNCKDVYFTEKYTSYHSTYTFRISSLDKQANKCFAYNNLLGYLYNDTIRLTGSLYDPTYGSLGIKNNYPITFIGIKKK